ncbi:hypothetical protein ABKV19_020482 [Rosa sericea]
MLPTRFVLSSLRCNGILGLRLTCDLPFTSYMLKICMGFMLACSHSDDHLLSSIAYPIGKVLDLVLGHGDDLFRRAQSKALVSIHDLEAGKGGELTHDNDYSGALDLTEKTAKEAMTPIESRLCLDVDSNLDWPWKTEVILKKVVIALGKSVAGSIKE